jgi:hypothetical protein
MGECKGPHAENEFQSLRDALGDDNKFLDRAGFVFETGRDFSCPGHEPLKPRSKRP